MTLQYILTLPRTGFLPCLRFDETIISVPALDKKIEDSRHTRVSSCGRAAHRSSIECARFPATRSDATALIDRTDKRKFYLVAYMNMIVLSNIFGEGFA